MMLDIFLILAAAQTASEFGKASGISNAPIYAIVILSFVKLALSDFRPDLALKNSFERPVNLFCRIMEKSGGLMDSIYGGDYTHQVFVVVCTLIFFIAFLRGI